MWPAMVAKLREFMAGLAPAATVFKMPKPTHVAPMFAGHSLAKNLMKYRVTLTNDSGGVTPNSS